jgi:hypothetical protein
MVSKKSAQLPRVVSKQQVKSGSLYSSHRPLTDKLGHWSLCTQVPPEFVVGDRYDVHLSWVAIDKKSN